MKSLPEARVARLAECHKEQKAGYDQHASFSMEPACSDIIKNTDLAEFMIHCEKQAFADATIQTKYKILRHMIKENVDLADPEAVKLYIRRNGNWSNGHKNLAVFTYNEYTKMKGIQWTPPLYPKNETLPFVPTEKEIDALISGTSKKVSIALQALKETGFRIGELWQCKWTDIDEEKGTLKCNNPEKGCKPREVRISAKLLARLNTLPKKNNYIFANTRLGFTRTNFDYQKKRLAEKLNNPRLKQIHFHTLRHYHATRLYNETKSLLEVQSRLGHRNINSTMVYTHIVQFDEESQNYHHAIEDIEDIAKTFRALYDIMGPELFFKFVRDWNELMHTIAKEGIENVAPYIVIRAMMQTSQLNIGTHTRIVKELLEQFPQAKKTLKKWIKYVNELF